MQETTNTDEGNQRRFKQMERFSVFIYIEGLNLLRCQIFLTLFTDSVHSQSKFQHTFESRYQKTSENLHKKGKDVE